jgi:Flp pilus assembly protein TadB
MENEELKQIIKEALAPINDRLDSVDGSLDDFNTTLNNHMVSYNDRLATVRTDFVKLKQIVSVSIRNLTRMFNWGFGVVIALLVVLLGTLGAVAVMLLQKLLDMMSSGVTP